MENICSCCEKELTVNDAIYYDFPPGSKSTLYQLCYDEFGAPLSVVDHVHVESIDNLCEKLDGVKFALSSPERIALFKHLQSLSVALREIEGDGDKEPETIMKAISQSVVLESCIEEAKKTIEHLTQLLKEIESS